MSWLEDVGSCPEANIQLSLRCYRAAREVQCEEDNNDMNKHLANALNVYSVFLMNKDFSDITDPGQY